MADVLKPDLMNALLGKGNWTLAANVQDRVVDPHSQFPRPRHMVNPALLVPVDVQALYVPASHSERYVRLPLELGEGAGKGKTTAPFSTPRARAKGVHLHWAMPDGLLRGDMVDDDDTPVKMQVLPNRWLVVRMTGRRGRARVDMRSWLIEADTGRVFDLPKYPNAPLASLDQQMTPEALTGIVGGSPNWTASYDASLNRFAFHDPLDGLQTSQILTRQASYVVVGWWSAPAHDPLSGIFSPYSVARRINRLNWTASSAPFITQWQSPRQQLTTREQDAALDKKGTDLRTALRLSTSQMGLLTGFRAYALDEVTLQRRRLRYETVMHGAVYGVPVAGGIGKDAAPRANRIELSMAPTLERLIAAQAASGMGVRTGPRKEYFESLLTAVANTSLMNIGNRDGIVQLDEAEHADGFEAFQGPETYEDVIVSRQQSALKGGRPLRTKAAKRASKAAPVADVIWNGGKRGRSASDKDSLRRRAQDIKYGRKGSPIDDAPKTRRVRRPGPRYHRPTSPVVGLRNYGRAQRFLGDGRFHKEGKLVCRWSEELATRYGEGYQASTYVPMLINGFIPAISNRILQNAFMDDLYMMPWIFEAIRAVVRGDQVGPTQNRLRGEMALRYSPDGVYDGIVPIARGDDTTPHSAKVAISDAVRRFSLAEGRDPSPVAVTSWVQPWSPVWLEWEVEVAPGRGFTGWNLGRMDFAGNPVPQGKKIKLQGRSAITSGLARTYKAVIDTYLIAENQRDDAEQGEINEGHEGTLSELSSFLKNADLGSVTLDRINDLWLAVETGPDGQVMTAPQAVAAVLADAGLPRMIADGTLRLTRARVVDTFGRFRDVPTTRMIMPAALSVKDETGAHALGMPPRLSLPGRLMWRFVDPADTSPTPAQGRLDQANPANMINPVSGYVLPDFIDESVEFFDQTGLPLGEVLHDPVTGGVIWESGVGRDGPASGSPMTGLPAAARLCGHIAQGMIETDIRQRNAEETADKESPLSAFLRAVDTTSWSVDSSLASAGATIAGLIGRPIAVVTTQMWLDIPQDLATTGAFGETADDIRDHLIREAAFDAVKSHEFKVRLGELAKGHDGLYGFFIGEDYSLFHLIEKEVVQAARISHLGAGFRAGLGGIPAQVGGNFLPEPSPLDAPYIGTGVPLGVHAGQKLRLTLLMHPSARVHATTGFLPRKSLELLNDWVSPGLGRVAPSARIGPVLIDPDKVRLPKIAAFGANQTWTRRNTPITWRDDPILGATQAAILPAGRVTVEEGYIRITPDGGPTAQEDG